MRIYVDIDGTITTQQRANSAFKCPLRQDVIDKVKKLAMEGHEIILWSGSTEYADRVAEHLNIPTVARLGKPQLIVDNETQKWGDRLKRRTVSPEAFLTMEIPEAT